MEQGATRAQRQCGGHESPLRTRALSCLQHLHPGEAGPVGAEVAGLSTGKAGRIVDVVNGRGQTLVSLANDDLHPRLREGLPFAVNRNQI
jgi:hypothetical protein